MWLIFAILAAVFWGLNYTLAEKILESISPFTLLALEMLVGGLLFFVASYFTSLKPDLMLLIKQPDLLRLTLIEIVTVSVAAYFIVASIQGKNATVAGIIELIYPIFIILFTWLIFHENHINFPVMIGGGLIVAGVVVISFS
jgi:drug/metabolite transporter (DMT)-like permease